MKDVFVYRYELRSRSAGNRLSGRKRFPGALVRIGSGFACVHPWPELGDLSLGEQLDALAGRGEMTPLARRSLACAEADGKAREEGENLFESLRIPGSHWLWNSGKDMEDQWESVNSGGFPAVKLKCSGSADDANYLDEIASGLSDGVLLRPDLNGALSPRSFREWWDRLGADVRARIEFVEDPMSYDGDRWSALSEETGASFALDREEANGQEGYRYRIVKPAVDDPDALDRTGPERLLFTSYLDHPIGQMFAAFCAAKEQAELGVCGLVSHLWFEKNTFSEKLTMLHGGRLVAPEGTGLGFDELLEELPWKRL